MIVSTRTTSQTGERKVLLKKITCPNCWHSFPPEEILWVSTHSDLRGDARLDAPGSMPFALQRFLPTRFTTSGLAIDSKGQPCQDLACPKCHLIIPWPLLDTNCLFFSILGSPGSGKSFLLSSMTWSLRKTLSQSFSLDFGDADPQSNATLNQYEESLFLRPDPEKPVPVRDLIKKTQFTEKNLFNTVYIGNHELKLPRPFLFEFKAGSRHPDFAQISCNNKVICLYDSAGESFQAVSDDADRLQTTAYMARSKALFFLFDPMQDQRFYAVAKNKSGDRGTGGRIVASRQETILRESAARIRRLLTLNQGALLDRPLIVVVNKWDAWKELIDVNPMEKPLAYSKSKGIHCLDMDKVKNASDQVRKLLLEHCPEIVSGAESFSRKVVYIPTSPLGGTPQPDPGFPDAETGSPLHTVKPNEINPWWAEVPMLYALSRIDPTMVMPVKRS